MRLATEAERNWVRSVLAITEGNLRGVAFVPHSAIAQLCTHFLESDSVLRLAVEAVTVLEAEIERLNRSRRGAGV